MVSWFEYKQCSSMQSEIKNDDDTVKDKDSAYCVLPSPDTEEGNDGGEGFAKLADLYDGNEMATLVMPTIDTPYDFVLGNER